MTTHVRIYRPAQTAMQSGQANTREWVMEFEPGARPTPDPIIGWIGSPDTRRQVTLRFETKEEAIDYVCRKGYTYTVREAQERRIKPKSYAANFAYDRREPWTH